jgi:outer membrane protein assembly factor BamB
LSWAFFILNEYEHRVREIRRRVLSIVTIVWLALATTACGAPPDVLRGLLPSPAARFVAEGDRLSAENRSAEAILAYRQAVARDERYVPALRKLARAYSTQGRRRLAQQYLQRAAALQPSDTSVAADFDELAPPEVTDGPLTPVWQALISEAPTGMAVENGVVYVAYEDGAVKTFDAATGALRWASKLPGRASSAPAAGSGLLLVGDQDGALHALDATDGQERWSYQTAAPIYAAPTVTAEAVYAPSGDGSFSALAPSNGKLLWKIDATAPLTGRAAVADGIVYFGSADGRIYGVDIATGREVWGSGIAAQGAVEAQPTVTDGRVLIGAGDSRVYALAADKGGEYWRHSTPDAIYARPLVISDTVFVASAGNTLSALNVVTGDLVWELDANSALRHAPAWADGTLYYVAAADPHLYAVDAATGNPLWQFDTGDWLAAGPVIADGMMVLLGQDGAVMGLQVGALAR